MKTVTDAVNRFKGEFPPVRDSDGFVVATYDQFNQCVEELSGDPIKLAEWKASKSMKADHTSEEFWKDAPEGAEYYNPVNKAWFTMIFTALHYKFKNSVCWQEAKAGKECNKLELMIARPRPKPSPVFTRAMADNGVQVDAGMLFSTEAGEYTAEYTNKKSICFTDENGFLVTITRGFAKPIDTRTDEEKAIDEACLVIDDSKRCIAANTNIDCSVAMKSVIITLIKNGWSKS